MFLLRGATVCAGAVFGGLCDEIAKCAMPKQPLTAAVRLRLGTRPRRYHHTPRPIALIKRLIADPATAVTRAGTKENAFSWRPASSRRS